MFVEKLELFGFKSFAHRTEVPLARGITAIVGPNGCGKSNISDAFRWVLGEQNARTLRGERIQDVIFKGTGAVKPLGMAEVVLEVSNEDGSLPLEYAQVSVARRVFRSGDSEFAINKSNCRLKDIRDLFSGTGLGSHGYAVIERDMVDQVLSDKDDARRFLFEEAAGIVRYKQRRKESERRLEGVEQDLTRIEDMIREIERGVRSLARQAGKVRRWRRFKEELDLLEVREAWEKWTELRLLSASSDELHRRKENERSDLSSRLAALDGKREARRTKLAELSDRLDEANRALEAAERSVSVAQEEIRVLTARNEAWTSEAQDLSQRLARDGRRLEELENERLPLGPRIAALEEELRGAEERAREADGLRAETERGLRDLRMRLGEAQQTTMDLSTAGSGTRQDLQSKRERKEAASKKLAALDARLTGLQHRTEKVEGGLGSIEERLADFETERAKQVSARGHLETRIRELRDRRETQARTQGEAERSRAALESRITVLEEQHARHAGFTAAVRRLLEAADEFPGVVGVVGEEVRLRAGREEAGRAILGDRIQWILMEDEASAVRALGRLRELGMGGVTFFPLKEVGRPIDGHPADPSVRETLEASDRARPFLGWLAAGTRLARDLSEARERARETGLCWATPDGDLVDPSGTLRRGGGESEEGEILRRESEIPRLKKELEAAENRLEVMEREDAALQLDEAAAVKDAEGVAALLVDLEQKRVDALDQRTALRTEQTMLREEATHLGLERSELAHEISFLDEEVARLEGLASRTDQDSEDARRSFEELRRKAEELEAERDERVRASSQREMEVLRLRGELTGALEKRQSLEREAEQLTSSIADGQRRSEERGREAEAATARIQQLQEGMADLEEARSLRGAERIEAKRAHQECQDALFQLDADLRQEREKLDTLVQSLHEDEVERLQTRSRADRIRERVLEEQGIDLETYEPVEIPLPKKRRRARRPSPAARVEDPSGSLAGNGTGDDPLAVGAESDGQDDLSEDGDAEDGPEDGEAGFDERAMDEERPAGELADDSGDGGNQYMDADQRRARIPELRQLIQGMGNLNFVAEEEYQKEKERLDFHNQQASDLRQAREDLLEAIRRINETAGKMFQETFDTVKENFKLTFDRLFPGGESSLTMEGTDPLEGDIEIAARPRGKRLESIRLLSSGERALTAIALLFAIYLAKPSPVCLLDEVDAPLDDANLDRFLGMVRHFSERTQFIVITHNKKTMETADRLFGVTMEEPGISKIVSVHLDQGDAEMWLNSRNSGGGPPPSPGDGSGRVAGADAGA